MERCSAEVPQDVAFRSVAGFQVPVAGSAVAVRRIEFHAHEVQQSMAHAPLSDDLVCHCGDRSGVAFEHHTFQTLFVIQWRLHGRDGEIMVRVLYAGQPLGEFPFGVIVNIG